MTILESKLAKYKQTKISSVSWITVQLADLIFHRNEALVIEQYTQHFDQHFLYEMRSGHSKVFYKQCYPKDAQKRIQSKHYSTPVNVSEFDAAWLQFGADAAEKLHQMRTVTVAHKMVLHFHDYGNNTATPNIEHLISVADLAALVKSAVGTDVPWTDGKKIQCLNHPGKLTGEARLPPFSRAVNLLYPD